MKVLLYHPGKRVGVAPAVRGDSVMPDLFGERSGFKVAIPHLSQLTNEETTNPS